MENKWRKGFEVLTYSQRHDLISDEEEEQMEVRHDVQECRGGALGQVCC